MTVYVDDMLRPARVGRIQSRWSHLMADTHDELMGFAARLGLRPEWIQHEGTHREHFDLTEQRRMAALRLDAVAIAYPRETGELLARKRAAAVSARETSTTHFWDPPSGGGLHTFTRPSDVVFTDDLGAVDCDLCREVLVGSVRAQQAARQSETHLEETS